MQPPTGILPQAIRQLAAAGAVPTVAQVQALVAGVAALGVRMGGADRAALADLVQRAAASQNIALPGTEQVGAKGVCGA